MMSVFIILSLNNNDNKNKRTIFKTRLFFNDKRDINNEKISRYGQEDSFT